MKRKKIICLENLPYFSHIQVGSHHYAKLFSNSSEVLWISLPWHILQLLKDKQSDRVKNWHFNKIFKIKDNLQSLTPFAFLPYRNNAFLKSKFYLKHYYRFMPALLKNIRNAGFDHPDILWFTDPRHISVLSYIKPKKIYYRCVDNLEHFDDIPENLLIAEKKLIEKANAVFFTSKDLMRKFDGLNSKSYYLPNGCDYDFFNKVHDNEDKMNMINKYFKNDKINILYTGAIAEWFDFNFLEEASRKSKYHFIIVGPIRTSIPDSIKTKDNVTFTGPFSYEYMPYFAKLSDIGIIPFKISEMTDSVNPIKLYEYCAAGLPTVVSGIKTVTEINGPYFIYNTKDDSQAVLDKAILKISDKKFKKEIREFAKNNSWTARFEFVKSIIERD